MQELKKEYNKVKKSIIRRLKDFSEVKPNDYFYELCFCILTPQSNAKICWEAVLDLKKRDFENKNINPKTISIKLILVILQLMAIYLSLLFG